MLNFTKFLLPVIFIFKSVLTLAQPAISSINPKFGPVGTSVTITGTNFSSTPEKNTVYFGAARATVISANNTTLTVKAPAGATYEHIRITSDTLIGYGAPFDLTYPGGVNIDSATFQPKMNISILQGVYSLAISDLDGDGKSDIAYSNAGLGLSLSPGVAILPNTSSLKNISFGSRIDYGIGGTNYDIAVGDLNGDGKPDIAGADYVSGYFRVMQNTSTPGNISFQPLVTTFKTDLYPQGVNIADFDGDGKADLLSVSGVNSPKISILRNIGQNGSIAFAPKVDFNTQGGTRVSVADVDGDGKVDVVYPADNTLGFYKNTSTVGNISFGPKISLGATSYITCVGDADGDGKADIVDVTSNGVSFFRNTGTSGAASFDPAVSFNTGVNFSQIFFLDVDGDGKPDLVGFNNTINTAYVLKNNSTPGHISFADKVGYGTGGRLYYIAGGDLDGDSKPEIVTYNMTDSISILRNKTAEPTTVSSGASPVTGNVETSVMVDQSVQSYNGNAYVQRHYDIEPDNNAGTSTATITIYFTQQDFDSYNAFPTSKLTLPTGPNDNVGKANLRVNQYHGTSSSGVPGTYSGSSVEIDPDDSKIVWNDLLKRWEVTFDVTGFSGFFISSSSIVALPLKLLSFDAAVKNDDALLQWTTTNEVNIDYFELQRSADGTSYNLLSRLAPKGINNLNALYNYSDKLTDDNNYYYRLKITDKDGSSTYSNVIKITFSSKKNEFSLYPNPAHGFAMAQLPNATSQSEIRIVDMSGKIVKNFIVPQNSTQTKINLINVKPGTYKMLWISGTTSKVQTIVIE